MNMKAYQLVIATVTSASLNNKLLVPDLILDMARATRIVDKTDDEDVDVDDIEVKDGDEKVHIFYLSMGDLRLGRLFSNLATLQINNMVLMD